MSIRVLLLVVAFVLFLLAGLNVPSGRVNLGWLGAAAATLSFFVA